MTIPWLAAAALATVLVTAAPTSPPVLPWTTFSGLAAEITEGRSLFQRCGDQTILVTSFLHRGDRHVVYFNPENRRVVWVFFRGDAAEPEWVGVGTVAEPPRHDHIPSLAWATHAEAQVRYAKGPCQYLAPVRT